MKNRYTHLRNRTKKTRVSASLALFLWIGLMFFGSMFANVPLSNDDSKNPIDEWVPVNYNSNIYPDEFPHRAVAGEPNLTRIMHPFILKMQNYTDLYNVLQGLNDTNIRVAYYDENYVWQLVPFQIDEVGNPQVWKDTDGDTATEGATLQNISTYIPYGDPYGGGCDQNPGHIDANDELLFYAYNGRQVDTTLWWNSTNYPNRTEVKIYDPVDGGQSWMYIYFNPTKSFEPITACSWYVDYVNWSKADLAVQTPIYSMANNATNPDLTSEIRIAAADNGDMVRAFNKQFTWIHASAGGIINRYFTQGQEGHWGAGTNISSPGLYTWTKSAIDNPTDPYNDGDEGNLASMPSNSNNIEGAGDHEAVIDGPVRVVVGKSTYSYLYVNFVLQSLYIYTYSYGNSFYYYSMTQGDNGTTEVPSNPDATIRVLYTYQAVVELNNTLRADYQINYGAEAANPRLSQFGNSRMKVCFPDGNTGNDQYASGGDPTVQGSAVPAVYNPSIPDWVFINSTTHGGMWMNVPRAEMTPLGCTMGMYWRDTTISETGIVLTNIQAGMKTDPYYTRVIFGEFKNIPNMNITGSLYYNQSKIQLTGISTFSQQYIPPDKPIFNSITPDAVVYKDGQRVTLSILCDHAGYSLAGNFGTIDSGFGAAHNASWVDNGGGSYTMTYDITAANSRFDGVYTINVTAWNATTGISTTTNTTQLELYNNIAVVNILSINAIPSTVYPGDTNRVVNVSINNTGGGPLNVTAINLKFYNGGTETTSNYTVSSAWPALPYRINNLSTAVEFTFNVDVKQGVWEGLTYINATASAIDLKLDTPVNDLNGSLNVDTWTVNVGLPPAIEGPSDLSFTIGTTGHILEWNITDLTVYNPKYTIYVDSVLNVTDDWPIVDNVTLDLDPHNLAIGEYNYTLVANDGYNKIVQDEVTVTVINDAPIIEGPGTVNYESGTTGNNITWRITDSSAISPQYFVYKDMALNYSGFWVSGDAFDIVVDGLSDGVYNWTIIAMDGYGGTSSNTVWVTVAFNPPPTISPAIHVVYQSGVTGNYLQWVITDTVIDMDATLWVYRNTTTQVNTSLWTSGFVVNQLVDGLGAGYWNFTIVVDDGFGLISQDEAIVTVNIPPVITTPPDQSWNFGTPGQYIYWTVTDNTMTPPTPYTIFRNGSSVQNNNWVNNTPISISLAGLAAGRWNYTVVASDGYGGTSSDQVWIVVNDQPYVSSTGDDTFDYGSPGEHIDWTIIDNVTFSPTYTVYRNTTYVNGSGAWTNNSVISIFMNGLGVGDWNFTLVLDDGNWTVSDEVLIHVLNVAPTISPYEDIEMAFGSTGNDLDWSITDASTNDPRYDIWHNQTLNVTNAQWIGNPILHNIDDLAIGYWNITIIFHDGYEGSCFDQVWVNVTTIADAENPTVIVTTPAMDAYLNENEIEVTGYANGTGSNINQLQVNNTLFSFTVTPQGTLEGPYTMANNSVVSGGYYVLNISVSDGVNRKAWVIIAFYVDLEAPTFIGLQNFALSAIIVDCGDSVTISIEVAEDMGIDTAVVAYQITGSPDVIALPMVLQLGNYTATIPAGNYKQAVYFHVSITDFAGHICASQWYNYTIGDNDAPIIGPVKFSVDLLSILEGDVIDVSVGPTDTAVGSGVKSVTLRYSTNAGQTYTDIRLIRGSDGNFKGTLPNLVAGTAVKLQVVVEDIAGNIATDNYDYIVGAKPFDILSILTSPFTIVGVGIFVALLVLVMRRRRGAEVRRLFGESTGKGNANATT